MKDPAVPLGRLEDQRLEFKSGKELDSISRGKSDLGRSVVAMLNAEGGVIWIGIAERDGRAAEIEDIANATRARDAVENHLSSTINPRLTPGEVTVDPVLVGSKTVLQVQVVEGRNKPYAFERQRSPFYLRVGSRVRGMTREELRTAFAVSEAPSSPAREAAVEWLRHRRGELQKQPEGLFWVGLVAVHVDKGWTIGFDLEDVRSRKLISDARATRSRQGSVLATDRIDPKFTQGSFSISHPDWGSIEIKREGLLEQRIPIERLWDRTTRNTRDDGRGRIHPIAWIENLVFPLRVMGAILNGSALRVSGSKRLHASELDLERVEVAVSVAMTRATGMRMRPHSPDAIGYMTSDERTLPTDDGQWHTEEVFSGSEMASTPDRCGLQLTKNFYADFQFSPLDTRGGDGIPRQFDRVSGRLILPE